MPVLLLAKEAAAPSVKNEEVIKGQRQRNGYVMEASEFYLRFLRGHVCTGHVRQLPHRSWVFTMPLGFVPGFVISEINQATHQTLPSRNVQP